MPLFQRTSGSCLKGTMFKAMNWDAKPESHDNLLYQVLKEQAEAACAIFPKQLSPRDSLNFCRGRLLVQAEDNVCTDPL